MQHFTEQRKKFLLDEMLFSFDHSLGRARCDSALFGADQKCNQFSRGIDFSPVILQIVEVHCLYSLLKTNIQLKYIAFKLRGF